MSFDFFSSGRRSFISRSDRLRKNSLYFDFILWGVPICLVFLSGLLIASTQREANYAEWYQHWIIALIGLFVAIFLAQISLERIRSFLLPIYLVTISSLVAVLIAGTSALGAQRWISIAGFNVQPSEFAKLTAILILAAVLEKHKVKTPINLLKPLSVIIIPWVLVFVQPDLGTSLVFATVLLTMLYWSGMPGEWVLLVLSGVFTAILIGTFPLILYFWIPFMGFLAYKSLPKKMLSAFIAIGFQCLIAAITPWLWMNALQEYQRDRLVLFLDPTKDPLGGGYHLLQSTIGIGSGGIFGTGLLQGNLTKLRFIPEQHTDFIFSALGEEMGFMGTILVISCFFILISRLINVALGARTDFESLVVVGVVAMLTFQIVVNIFMTIGLGPVTGIPLPFMSYGRSALLVNFAALGLCISVARRGYAANKNL